jgi:Tfp pilus assembly protein FimT
MRDRTMKWAHYNAGFFRTREGFTILRLLVTMAIVAVLVGAAFPNIASVTRAYSVRSAARQVYSEVQNARMSAVMANQSYTFTINGGGTTYTVSPSPGTATALEATGITMSAPSAITFASDGTASATATVTVTNSFGDTMQVAVGSAGRVRIQ